MCIRDSKHIVKRLKQNILNDVAWKEVTIVIAKITEANLNIISQKLFIEQVLVVNEIC